MIVGQVPLGLGWVVDLLHVHWPFMFVNPSSFSLLNELSLFLVEYPMALLPHSTPVKRSSGTVFRQVPFLRLFCRSSHFVVFLGKSHNNVLLQDTSQPLNLTAKPKTPSPQALEMAHLQTGYRPRDLQRSPPRSALSLSMWCYTSLTHPVSNIKHSFNLPS